MNPLGGQKEEGFPSSFYSLKEQFNLNFIFSKNI
tara:strand:+ start:235 stop:336 length:102 start_codon:yes stop_codon:yes gene_type:complete